MARGDGPIGHQSRFQGFVTGYGRFLRLGFLRQDDGSWVRLREPTFEFDGFPFPTAGAWVEGWQAGPRVRREATEITAVKPWDAPEVVAERERRFRAAHDNASSFSGSVGMFCKGILVIQRKRDDGTVTGTRFDLNMLRYSENDAKDGLSFEDLGWMRRGMDVRVKWGRSWSGGTVLAVEPVSGS